jgi:hypothetical protein
VKKIGFFEAFFFLKPKLNRVIGKVRKRQHQNPLSLVIHKVRFKKKTCKKRARVNQHPPVHHPLDACYDSSCG